MKNIYFTSDQHFGHKNIIKFSERPFADVEEMNESMIEKWNAKVGPEDEVYHLGDVALCSSGKLRKILQNLNGKIHLIKGNHERAALDCKSEFEWIKDYHELIIDDEDFPRGKQLVVLFHYSIREWHAQHHGSYHLYGHSHGTLSDDPNSLSFDIGVDCHDFAPLSWQEVKDIMKTKTWKKPF